MVAIERVTQSYNKREIVVAKCKIKKSSTINYDQYIFIKKIHSNMYVDTSPNTFGFTSWISGCFIPDIFQVSKQEELFQTFLKNKELSYRLKLTFFKRIVYKNNIENVETEYMYKIRLFLFYIL